MPSQVHWPNNDVRPVERVSWNDMQVFLSRLNDMEETAGRLPAGWKYVLPTEAQWEYACRAGTTTAFSWGNISTSTQANYNWDGGGALQATILNKPLAWVNTRPTRGAFLTCMEMSGNGSMIGRRTTRVAIRPSLRVRLRARVGSKRSGSWAHDGSSTCVQRSGNTPGQRNYNIGFRVGFQAVQPDTANPELEFLVVNTLTTREVFLLLILA